MLKNIFCTRCATYFYEGCTTQIKQLKLSPMKSCSCLIGVSVFKYFISTESKFVIFYYKIFIKVVLIASQEVEILEFDKDNFKIRAVG